MDVAIKKLRWACRRGMLELDVMLNPFLEDQYAQLTEEEQAAFRRLLDQEDQDLFEWLTDKQQCTDVKLQKIIQRIRHYAENRPR